MEILKRMKWSGLELDGGKGTTLLLEIFNEVIMVWSPFPFLELKTLSGVDYKLIFYNCTYKL